MWNRIYIALILACTLCACSARQHIFLFSLGEGWSEARHTLDVADSLRVNEGRLYDDSLALAEAYMLLGHWRLIYPDDYARACYYYGRMLRHRGDQVAAMRAFIAGSHAPYLDRVVPLPWFSDYHILGRIYSNMGSMCHEDDEFQLSYDMYELSASCFLEVKDSLRFIYGEISKVFEIISLQRCDTALTMLSSIESVRQDSEILAMTNLFRGYAYRNMAQYDKAISSANRITPRYQDPAFLILKAQCFASLDRLDSATYFAKLVMQHPSAPIQNKYNAAYIIIHADSCLSMGERDYLINYRSDLGVMRREEKSTLSHAVEILLLDLQRTPSEKKRNLLLALALILCLMSIVAMRFLIIWLRHIRIETFQKKEVIQEYQLRQSKRLKEVEKTCAMLRSSEDIKAKLHWNSYAEMCEQVDLTFDNFTRFIMQDYKLNETEMRLCILVILDFPQKQIAKILPCAESSVKATKRRTAQKLHTNGKDLRKFLIKYIVGDLK